MPQLDFVCESVSFVQPKRLQPGRSINGPLPSDQTDVLAGFFGRQLLPPFHLYSSFERPLRFIMLVSFLFRLQHSLQMNLNFRHNPFRTHDVEHHVGVAFEGRLGEAILRLLRQLPAFFGQ